jgi:hypothetical protein
MGWKFVIRLERIDRPGESWCKMNGQMLVKRDNCEMPGNIQEPIAHVRERPNESSTEKIGFSSLLAR